MNGTRYGRPMLAYADFASMVTGNNMSVVPTCILCILNAQAFQTNAPQTVVCVDEQLSEDLCWMGPAGNAPLFPLHRLRAVMYDDNVHDVVVSGFRWA